MMNHFNSTPFLETAFKQSGITLIEALITILVTSIGLLGVAALQSTSIKYTYDSYLRTQSSLLASDLFDRMRANPLITYDDINASTSTNCAETTADCNPLTMMQYDLEQWRASRDAIFGNSTGTTTELTADTSASPPEEFTITFRWDSRTEDGDAVGTTPIDDGRQIISFTARVK